MLIFQQRMTVNQGGGGHRHTLAVCHYDAIVSHIQPSCPGAIVLHIQPASLPTMNESATTIPSCRIYTRVWVSEGQCVGCGSFSLRWFSVRVSVSRNRIVYAIFGGGPVLEEFWGFVCLAQSCCICNQRFPCL
jgi:hypothetical protein